MKSALIGAMVGTATGMMCPSTPAAWPAAGMKITTMATTACQFVEEEIDARINGQTDLGTGAKWHDPHNNGKYTLTNHGGTVVHTLMTSRVTGDGKYTDKQIFTLTPSDDDKSCKIEACSRSQVTSIFDMGTNYCDLKMLYCGKKDGCKPVKNDFEVGMEKTEAFSQASVDLEKCFTKADVVNVALTHKPKTLLEIGAMKDPFTESAKFERWSHFKDYGVPAVMGKDALNSAAIADGTCRFVQQNDGFYFWHYPSRVERVLKALADAPPTSNPSYFVLSADKALRNACSDKSDKASRPEYKLDSLAGSVQNWYHALTAPSSDPSWKGQYDPAYQPQQVALTAGLMFITACDLNGAMSCTEPAMRSLALRDFAKLREAVNTTFPWVAGNTRFSGASSVADLAHSLKPWLETLGFTIRASELDSILL